MENEQENPVADKRSAFVRELIEWTKSIAIAVVIALTLKATVVQSYVIPTGSMIPTINPGARVLGNRLVYRFHDPEPGDVISFMPPERARTICNGNRAARPVPYLKRIIGVGGDVIEIRGGIVYRNGDALDEPYVKELPNDFYPVVVPEGNIFVMGDNRRRSCDSRMWGTFPAGNIQAKAFFHYWPPSRIGLVH